MMQLCTVASEPALSYSLTTIFRGFSFFSIFCFIDYLGVDAVKRSKLHSKYCFVDFPFVVLQFYTDY